MSTIKTLLLLIGLLALSQVAFAQSRNFPLVGAGRIWYPYLLPEASNGAGDTVSRFFDLYFASEQDTAVTILIGSRSDPNLNDTLSLPGRSGKALRLTTDLRYMILGSEKVSDRAILIRSSSPISVSSINGIRGATDGGASEGTTVPSEQFAGTNFRAISYFDRVWNDQLPENALSELVMSAFEDSTLVTIIPSVATLKHAPANSPIAVRLDAGQSYQVQTEYTTNPDDLTGSAITSNKPISVFGAHGGVDFLPRGFLTSSSVSGPLLEAVPGVERWGRAFGCQPIAWRHHELDIFGAMEHAGDVVRILALNPRTRVFVNGKPWGALLNANAFRDTLINAPIQLEATGPVAVSEYSHSMYWDEDSTGNTFMVMVPPLNQMVNHSVFFLPQDSTYNRHYMNIVTESSGRNKLLLDGKPVLDTMFVDLPIAKDGGQCAVGSLRVAPGYHQLTSTNDSAHGFNAFAYGTPGLTIFDGVTHFPNGASYGYTVSSGNNILQGVLAEQTLPANTSGSATIKLTNLLQLITTLDSATFSLDSIWLSRGYSVKSSRRIGVEAQYLGAAQSDTIKLTISPSPKDSVTGTITVYHHTATSKSLVPAFTDFVVPPFVQSVADRVPVAGLETTPVSPNPSMGNSCRITFGVRTQTVHSLEIKIVDLLGRTIGEGLGLRSGADWQRVSLRSPTSDGSYFVEITSGVDHRFLPFVVTR